MSFKMCYHLAVQLRTRELKMLFAFGMEAP